MIAKLHLCPKNQTMGSQPCSQRHGPKILNIESLSRVGYNVGIFWRWHKHNTWRSQAVSYSLGGIQRRLYLLHISSTQIPESPFLFGSYRELQRVLFTVWNWVQNSEKKNVQMWSIRTAKKRQRAFVIIGDFSWPIMQFISILPHSWACIFLKVIVKGSLELQLRASWAGVVHVNMVRNWLEWGGGGIKKYYRAIYDLWFLIPCVGHYEALPAPPSGWVSAVPPRNMSQRRPGRCFWF